MSTVATARGPSVSSVLTQIAAESSTLRPIAAMHPDCLLLPLQPHNVSSPRLSTLSPPVQVMDVDQKHAGSPLRTDDDPDDENDLMMDDAVSSTGNGQQQNQNDFDAVSVCSDTSVLSVGQETHDDARDTDMQQQQQRQQLQQQHQRRHNSAFCSVQVADGSDARSSISTDEPATTPHYLEDEPQQQQPQQITSRPVVMDPFLVANALRIPVPLVPRSNSSPYQEEFLRKSQLYAGEIMKQQMQLMAAARANAFALRPNDHQRSHSAANSPHFAQLTAISKITQLNAVAAAAAAAAAVVANNQKLNAPAVHSLHTNSSDALAQLSALSMAQQQTVSNLNRLHAQMHMPQHNPNYPHNQSNNQGYNNINNNNNSNHHNNNNNNFHHDQHESSLKFSIDNILKADFGRRIAAAAAAVDQQQTLLLGKRRNDSSTFLQTSPSTSTPSSTTSSTTTAHSNAVMDLSSLMSSAVSAASSNFSNSLANICTNSNDSNSTVFSGSNNNNNNSDFIKSPNSSIISNDQTAAINRLTNASNEKCESFSSEHPKNVASAVASMSTTTASASASASASVSTSSTSSTTTTTNNGTGASGSGPIVWPAWVYCTRYSDRPSSGRSPRTRKPKKTPNEKGNVSPSSGSSSAEDKRPRTAFSGSQLARLKHEFTENRYLTEKRRQQLSSELGLNEAQIKIWFQNKRAKLKKSSGTKNPLALQLMAQGLYNHSTVPLTREEEELQEMQEREREAAAAAAAATATTPT